MRVPYRQPYPSDLRCGGGGGGGGGGDGDGDVTIAMVTDPCPIRPNIYLYLEGKWWIIQW